MDLFVLVIGSVSHVGSAEECRHGMQLEMCIGIDMSYVDFSSPRLAVLGVSCAPAN
jgi:hypothetical protein